MNNFEVRKSKDNLTINIVDTKNNYSLNLLLSKPPLNYCNYTFDIYWNREKGQGNFITARDIGEYDEEIKSMIINPSLQYVEVGAGLGEFIPRIIRRFGDSLVSRPIVVDPAKYEVMYSLLDFARKLETNTLMYDKLGELKDRCEIILDNKKVRLVNFTLEKAVSEFPELLGVADVVVDHIGASHYMEDHECAWRLEEKFLKWTGRLYSEVVKSKGVFRPR